MIGQKLRKIRIVQRLQLINKLIITRTCHTLQFFSCLPFLSYILVLLIVVGLVLLKPPLRWRMVQFNDLSIMFVNVLAPPLRDFGAFLYLLLFVFFALHTYSFSLVPYVGLNSALFDLYRVNSLGWDEILVVDAAEDEEMGSLDEGYVSVTWFWCTPRT